MTQLNIGMVRPSETNGLHIRDQISPEHTGPLDERGRLQARNDAGERLTPVEQGLLARLSQSFADRAGPASTGTASNGSSSVGQSTIVSASRAMARTAADFKVIGGNKRDVAELNAALKYLSTSKTAAAMLAKLPKGTRIQIIHDGNDRYSPATKTVFWDPLSGLKVTGGKGTQSAALGLIHEIDHALGLLKDIKPTGDGYENTEEKRVIRGSETKIARELGEPTRTDHYGEVETLKNSTAHTKVK